MKEEDRRKWESKLEGLLNDMDLSELVREPVKDMFHSLIERFTSLKDLSAKYPGIFEAGLDNEKIAEIIKQEFDKYERNIRDREKEREDSAKYHLSSFLKNEVGFSNEDMETIYKLSYSDQERTEFYKFMREMGFDFFIIYKKKYISLEDFQQILKRNKCFFVSKLFFSCINYLKEILRIKVGLGNIDLEGILKGEITNLEKEVPYQQKERIEMISELFRQASELYEKGIKKKFGDEEIERRKNWLIKNIFKINELYQEINSDYSDLREYFVADMTEGLRYFL